MELAQETDNSTQKEEICDSGFPQMQTIPECTSDSTQTSSDSFERKSDLS